MGQLLEVVAAFEEALDPAAARAGEAELAPVLAAALEPLLDMCERSAEALSVDHPSRCGEVIACHACIAGSLAAVPWGNRMLIYLGAVCKRLLLVAPRSPCRCLCA